MEKMSFKKLFGYSIGDFGGNIAFGTVVGLVTFFIPIMLVSPQGPLPLF